MGIENIDILKPGDDDEPKPVKRWEGVFGHIKTEFNIDENNYRVVFHVEYNGYFSGYYMDKGILDEENRALYKMVLDQIVKDLEAVT